MLEDDWDRIKKISLIFTQPHKRDIFMRYVFPIFLLVIIFVIKYIVNVVTGRDLPDHLLTLVVIASALYGGLGPGLFSTFLSIIAYDLFFLPSKIAFFSFDNFLTTSIFLIVGILLSFIIEAKHQVDLQKDAFIGILGHEIRNPLTSLKSYVQILEKFAQKRKMNTEVSYLKKIDTQAETMNSMISDLLDVSQMEAGRFTYVDEQFVVYDVVKDAVTEQQLLTKTHTIRLTGKSTKSIVGDRKRIKQVIVNLLTNALKYSTQADRVLVRIVNKKTGIQITVKDFGIGIPKDQVGHVFDRFFRTSNVRKNTSQGTGLGLSIANQIIKHHKGKVWVTSTFGKGSTFYLYFPAKEA